MDLGISGRRAIVCASSRGLGRACAMALAAEGVHVVINGRDPDILERTADEIRTLSDVEVTPVIGDVTTRDGRSALLTACPSPDILINNNAGPKPGLFATHTYADWLAALEGNMLAAIELIGAVIGDMRERRFGRIVNITSAMVTTPWPVMGLSSGARAGLTAVCKGLSIEVARDNVTINNLLPERFDTDRQIFMAERAVAEKGISFDEARREQVAEIPAGRLGRPEEFGAMCAFFCSSHVGFSSGLNIHLDGGAYPALV